MICLTFPRACVILYPMSEYCKTVAYPLRYSSFDFKDELHPSALLDLAQEAATASADELGFGYADLKPNNFGFIIVNTYCELRRPVVLGETVTMETWPLPPRHVFFERDYRARVGEEEVAAIASRWCLVDLSTFSMLRPEALGAAHENCPYRAQRTAEPPSWKIPRITSGKEVYTMRVGVSHCDHYLHANNARYADFFFDCFTMDELRERRVRSFQLTYSKQAKPGSVLSLWREDREYGAVCEVRCEGELLTQFLVRFA